MSSKTPFDFLAALQDECVPVDFDMTKTSHSARFIGSCLLAIAEQLKEARSDQKYPPTTSVPAETVNRDDPYANFTDADFEEMAREDLNKSRDYTDDDCRDTDPEIWTDDEGEDVEGVSDER